MREMKDRLHSEQQLQSFIAAERGRYGLWHAWKDEMSAVLSLHSAFCCNELYISYKQVRLKVLLTHT